jgi:hypothetical protein
MLLECWALGLEMCTTHVAGCAMRLTSLLNVSAGEGSTAQKTPKTLHAALITVKLFWGREDHNLLVGVAMPYPVICFVCIMLHRNHMISKTSCIH